jgi:hypothetical protein
MNLVATDRPRFSALPVRNDFLTMNVAAALMMALTTPGAAPGVLMMLDPFHGAVPVLEYSFESNEDADYDGFPDDWSRRKGPGFPSYIKAIIDRREAAEGKASLSVEANGGGAAFYSPPTPVDATHSWLLEASVRTQKLKNDAAVVSVSFLDHRWQRIERHLTRPVSGTHEGWVPVRLGPISPPRNAHFVVIGCHLVAGTQCDLQGTAWFDAIRLKKLPQMELMSNFHTHFRHRSAPIEARAVVSGLDDGESYHLKMQILDSSSRTLAETYRNLTEQEPAQAEAPSHAHLSNVALEEPRKPNRLEVEWTLAAHDYGYYEVRAELQRAGKPILEARTSFTVFDLGDAVQQGEFGWSLEGGPGEMPLRELADVAVQSGINWLKLPLWQSVYDNDKEKPGQIAEFFDRLSIRGITPVGMLNDPPPALRSKFARNWTGISEIFTMPPKFWSPSLSPVLARYASTVRHWQLGGETDDSFIGMARLDETLVAVKQEFDRIGRDTRVGVHWTWETPPPQTSNPSALFLSLGSREEMTADALHSAVRSNKPRSGARWALLRPLARSKHTDEERACDLVRKMVAARIGGANAIFATDVFHPEYGILNPSGAPTRLYLPWRTTAIALQGAEYLGSFDMPGRSVNHVFVRGGEMMMVVWNETPTEESMYLGEHAVANDIQGRQQLIPVDTKTARQTFAVGPMPLTIRGGSEPVARLRLGTRFEKGRVPSAYGEHRDAIVGTNTFPQGVNGQVTVNFPPEWEVEPKAWTLQVAAGEKFRLPMRIVLPPNASLGQQDVSIDFDIVADRQYKFRVMHTYEVGLGNIGMQVVDRKLPDGRLEIEQLIKNSTSPAETLSFRCSLFIPQQRRQILFVTKLGQGEDRKFYHLANADALRGQELWIRAEQVGGLRVLNYKWKVGESWDAAAK